MNLLRYIPPRPLANFVDLFWLVDGPAPAHGRERLLPTGTMELVIDLRTISGLRVPLLCGPHSESFVLETAPQAAIMGVHFKPGGAFPFFKVPAGWSLFVTAAGLLMYLQPEQVRWLIGSIAERFSVSQFHVRPRVAP